MSTLGYQQTAKSTGESFFDHQRSAYGCISEIHDLIQAVNLKWQIGP